MGADMDSYQLKAICKQCGKVISLKTERIKSHLLKCGKGNDLGEYEEIASLVRVWDKKTESNNPKNLMPSKPDSTEEREPLPQTWTSDAEAEWRRENDLKYLPNVIDYNEFPNKRYRSDSENTNESDYSPDRKRFKEEPRYWSEGYDSDESSKDVINKKRQRSESGSDLSDDPPLSK